MAWSCRIGRVFGIDVHFHGTFFLLIAWLAGSHLAAGGGVAEAVNGAIFLAALVGIVVLHELGHALTARRFGIRTRDITLLPIGGVARLERMPDDPRQEMLVALAGPAVNLGLAAVVYAILLATSGTSVLSDAAFERGPLVARLFWVNVSLGLFNLVPAFPMDGGRVLRALLALRRDYVDATRVAASVGQGLALSFAMLGLFTNPFLVFVALFVWIGAAAESESVQVKSVLAGLPIGRAMITEFRTLSPTDPLQRAVDYVVAGFQAEFPVVDDGRPVGVLTQGALLEALARNGASGRVGDVMARSFVTADPTEMVERVFARLETVPCGTIPVVRDGRIVGIVTMENIAEVVAIREALRSAERRSGRAFAADAAPHPAV